jgi:hypothetical protein
LVTASGAEIRLQQEDARLGVRAPEVVAYIAISASDTAGLRANVKGSPASVSFGRSLTDAVVLADSQTRNDAAPQVVHIRAQSATGASFATIEDKSKYQFNSNARMAGETVGYAAFDAGSLLGARTGDARNVTEAEITAAQQLAAEIEATGVKAIGQAGSVTVNVMSSANLQTPIRVNYAAPIEDAVVMLTGENNLSTRYTLRVVSQDENGFSFVVEDWANTQFSFSLMNVKVQWIALSAGSYELQDGRRLEVGRVSTTDTASKVQFASAFTAAPVVITTTQTRNDARAVDSSPHAINASGFDARLQSYTTGVTRPAETVGYLAVSQGGAASSSVFAGSASSTGSYTPPFDLSSRVILVDTQTRNSASSAVTRYSAFGPWINFHLDNYGFEQVGIAAFTAGTIDARKL